MILKHASASRSSGQWSDDDYLLENGVIVGRIFKVPIAPQDRPWMWASGHNGHIANERIESRQHDADGSEPGRPRGRLTARGP